MEGVVALLDPAHDALTRALWAELDAGYGLSVMHRTPFPHFSFQVARGYQREALRAAAQAVAREWAPFTVTTAGLGVFTGDRPVLYVPVVRSAALARLHAAVWAACAPAAEELQAYYRPDGWVPHITLAEGEALRLGSAVQALAARPLAWEIVVDNLAYIAVDDGRQVLQWRIPFGGAHQEVVS